MIPRLFSPQPLTPLGVLALDGDAHRYLTRTLRLGPGAPLVLFDSGNNGEWDARILDSGPPLRVETLRFRPLNRESPLVVTLVQAMVRSNAMEIVVQKGVELGVAAVIPLYCQRSVVRPTVRAETNKTRRWQKIAAEAAEQCGRTCVPTIHPPLSWAALGSHLPLGPRWLFWEAATARPAWRSLPSPDAAVTLLVGPEGGLTTEEVAMARDLLGFRTLGLGPRILRTETAALTAMAACHLLWGDLG